MINLVLGIVMLLFVPIAHYEGGWPLTALNVSFAAANFWYWKRTT